MVDERDSGLGGGGCCCCGPGTQKPLTGGAQIPSEPCCPEADTTEGPGGAAGACCGPTASPAAGPDGAGAACCGPSGSSRARTAIFAAIILAALAVGVYSLAVDEPAGKPAAAQGAGSTAGAPAAERGGSQEPCCGAAAGEQRCRGGGAGPAGATDKAACNKAQGSGCCEK